MDEVVARAEIADLHAKYVHLVDGKHAARFADLFSPDGVLESFTGRRVVGRAAITEYVANLMATRTDDTWVGIRHHVCPAHVEFSGMRTATAVSYFTAYNDASVDHWGVYSDRLTRVGRSWTFAARRVSIEGRVEGGWVGSGAAGSTR